MISSRQNKTNPLVLPDTELLLLHTAPLVTIYSACANKPLHSHQILAVNTQHAIATIVEPHNRKIINALDILPALYSRCPALHLICATVFCHWCENTLQQCDIQHSRPALSYIQLHIRKLHAFCYSRSLFASCFTLLELTTYSVEIWRQQQLK